MRGGASLALAGLLSSAAAAAQSDPPKPPALTTTRFDEDWSQRATPSSPPARWTAPFKYISLGSDAYLTTGIELRLRNQDLTGILWGDAPDDGYAWLRALPYADLHVGQARAFVQPIAARAVSMSAGPSPIDQSGVDLLQAFGEVSAGPLTVRIGRQMMPLGSERLVGTRYGPNVPLAFDGGRAIVTIGRVRLSLFAVRPVSPALRDFDDRRSRTKSLWGAYATLPGLDVYYLGYRNKAAHFDGRQGGERRHSLGLRSFGSRGGWHWNVEGVYQFGSFAGGPISAWTLATELGHSFPDARLAPDVTLRINLISGDRRRGDGRVGTFNALFPKGNYFGELSPLGPYNIVNLHPHVGVRLGKTVTAGLTAMAYWRFSRGDGIYDIPGSRIRAPGTATARFIGGQGEATLAWQATPELQITASASLFAPGAFIRQTGPARTITMLGLESNFRF